MRHPLPLIQAGANAKFGEALDAVNTAEEAEAIDRPDPRAAHTEAGICGDEGGSETDGRATRPHLQDISSSFAIFSPRTSSLARASAKRYHSEE